MPRENREGELAGRWGFRLKEVELLKTKPQRDWLGFVNQLKFFQNNGWFPENVGGIPEAVVSHLAEQLEIGSIDLCGYGWSARTGRRDRAEILDFLGHRRMTAADRQVPGNWLREAISPLGVSTDEMVERTFQWCLDECFCAAHGRADAFEHIIE